MSKKGKKAVMLVDLQQPYDESVVKLHTLAGRWGMRVLKSGYFCRTALLEMSENQFKLIFGQEPQLKLYPAPAGTNKFINFVTVQEIC